MQRLTGNVNTVRDVQLHVSTLNIPRNYYSFFPKITFLSLVANCIFNNP
jgi:hypothetical protein